MTLNEAIEAFHNEHWLRRVLRKLTGSVPAHHELVIENARLMLELKSERALLAVYREQIIRLAGEAAG